jgi:hypothetical protein
MFYSYERNETSFLVLLRITVIILILAVFGFNIFTNLGYVTDELAFIIEPIASLFARITGKTTKDVVKTSNTGTREITKIVDETVDTIDDTINNDTINYDTKIPNTDIDNEEVSSNIGQNYEKPVMNTVPEPDYSNSQVQQGTVGKKGYCYVGNWNGFRSCVKVSESTRCMSGMLYDSEELCRNPELRA